MGFCNIFWREQRHLLSSVRKPAGVFDVKTFKSLYDCDLLQLRLRGG